MICFGRVGLVAGFSLMLTACGRKGVLIYPDMLIPAAPSAVSAQQSGSVVKLQFALPDKDRAGRPVQGVTGVKISRRTSDAGQKDICRSCQTNYSPLLTIYLEHLPASAQRFGSRLVVLDSEVTAANYYSYRIVPFTINGVEGASSPTAEVRMDTSLPAPVLQIEALPTELKLQFSLQLLMSDRLLGFNLYRSSGATARSYQPLNRETLKGREYVDIGLDRGVNYHYTARALIMRASGDIAESAESQEVVGMLKDDE